MTTLAEATATASAPRRSLPLFDTTRAELRRPALARHLGAGGVWLC